MWGAFVWILLLGHWLAAPVRAATILSRSPVTDVIDGVVQRTQTLTVQCDAADYDRDTSFTLTKADGTSANLTVHCNPVQYVFDITALGKMYTDKILTTRRLCTYWQVPNTTIIDILGTAPANGGGGGARRRLLGFDFEAAFGRAVCGNEIGAFFTSSCGGNGPTQDDIDHLQRQVDALNRTGNIRLQMIEQLQARQQRWDHDLFNVTQQTTQIQKDMASAILSTDARFAAFGSIANATSNAVSSLIIAQRTAAEQVNANFANLTAQINNVNGAIGNTLVQEFNKSYTTMYQLQTNLTGAIHQLRDITQNAFNDAYLRERVITRAVRDISTGVLKINQQFEETRGFTRLLLDAISDLPSGYVPFLLNTGTLPATNDDTWIMPLETTRFVYLTASNLAAVQVTISYLCNARYLLNNFKGWYIWKDFVETMGPPGCDPSASTGPTVCNCYVSVATSECSPQAGAASAPAFLYNLTLDGSVCSGPVTVSPTQLIYQGSTVLSTLATYCSSIGTANLTLGSILRKVRVAINNDASSCSVSYSNLDAPINGEGLPFVLLSQWELTARSLLPNIPVLMDYFDGIGPQGATFKNMPFQRLDNSPGRCVEAAFNAYTSNVETVYRIDPVEISVSATATVTGAESVTGSSPLVGVSLLAVLPEGGTAVVGDPSSNATVYDIPNPMIGLVGGQPHTVNYHMQPHVTNMTQAAWEDYWTQSFDHYADGPPASLFRTTVNASTGRCHSPGSSGNLSSYYAGVGSWCDLRDAYTVRTSPSQPGRINLVPRSGGAYTVTFTVSEGDITQSLLSVCPTVLLETTGSGVLVVLQNPRSAAVRATLKINTGLGAGNCEVVHSNLLVPAGSSTTQFVARCNSGSIGQIASVWRVLGNGTLALCPGLSALNITTSATTYTSTFGNAAVTYVDSATATQASQVSLAMMDIFTQMQNLVQQTIYVQASVFQRFGLTTNLSWYDDVLTHLGNLSTSINTTLQLSAPSRTNVSELDAIATAFEAQLTVARAAQETARQTFLANMANVTLRIGELDRSLLGLNETLVLLDVARAAYVESERQFTNALNNFTQGVVNVFQAIKDRRGDGGPFGDLFGLFGDIVEEVIDAGKDVGGWYANTVQDIINRGLGILDKITAGFGNIVTIVLVIIVVVGGVAGAVVIYRLFQRTKGMSPGGIDNLSEADVAKLRMRLGLSPGPGGDGITSAAYSLPPRAPIANLLSGSKPVPPPPTPLADPVAVVTDAGATGRSGLRRGNTDDPERAFLLAPDSQHSASTRVPPAVSKPPTRWYDFLFK